MSRAEVEVGGPEGRHSLDRGRSEFTAFVSRHEVPWELTMAALAVAYVAIGIYGDMTTTVPTWLLVAEAAITVIFVLEFVSRLWASADRGRYLRGHWIDLIALVPSIREVRVLRLLRFLRLIRAIASLHRAIGIPLVARVAWHLRRVARELDVRTALLLAGMLLGLVGTAAVAVTWIEGPLTLGQLGEATYWAITTLLGSGDASFVSSFPGRTISGALIVSSLTFLAVVTGLVIGFIIDVVLREGQGMGVSGLQGHTVVCGWNDTAREVIEELHSDDQGRPIALLADLERNPAGGEAHFVRGDPTSEADLERVGIRDAAAAIVVPDHHRDDADMRSILVVMAIKHMAPHVRVVAEAASSENMRHLERAMADEVISTPQLAAHLLARASANPGLTELVMDMVSGGEGSELYRIPIPEPLVGRQCAEAAVLLRTDHHAVLLGIVRDGRNVVNPAADVVLADHDEIVLLAESLDSFGERVAV